MQLEYVEFFIVIREPKLVGINMTKTNENNLYHISFKDVKCFLNAFNILSFVIVLLSASGL